jgi:hypothetical protein
MKNVILYLSLILVCGSCAPDENKKIHIRDFAFNDNGLKVITTQLNDTLGTMCMLYGNAPAFERSVKRNARVAGEMYKLVTYKQQDHPFWYGSKINGALMQIETIHTVQQAGQIVPVYTVEYAELSPATRVPADTAASIKYMMNAAAAYFP